MISWTSWAVGVALHFTAIQKYEHISTILRKEPNSIFEFTTQMSILRKDLLCETLKVRPKGIGASLSFKLCKQKSHVIASNILLKFRIKKKGFKCCSRRCRLRCSTLLMMWALFNNNVAKCWSWRGKLQNDYLKNATICVCVRAQSHFVSWSSYLYGRVCLRMRSLSTSDNMVLKICSRALLSRDFSKLWLSIKLCDFPNSRGFAC